MTYSRYVIPFRGITFESLAEVGGKNASLGELLRELSPHGPGKVGRIEGRFRSTARGLSALFQAIFTEPWVVSVWAPPELTALIDEVRRSLLTCCS